MIKYLATYTQVINYEEEIEADTIEEARIKASDLLDNSFDSFESIGSETTFDYVMEI